ncbi:MAG: DegT/DnrJ/EryC1/StrS family aminotransferase [Bryobacteraceae bacterium]
MHVPLIRPDLPSIEDVQVQFAEILSSGRITNFGKYVNQFEAETADYLGVPTVAVSSGSAGLIFTLCALGLDGARKVILPSFTFMATAQAVLFSGGVPVFAEVDDDLNLSATDLERLLRLHPDTGAVIPVHMYGLPARTAEIEAVVERASRAVGRRIAVMYDAAHAFGASAGGRRVGGFGDAEVFSLSVTKVLVTVEGGLVASHRPELIERIRCMRNYGIRSNYNAHFAGLNGKMSEFHAIVGLQNLRKIDSLMAERQRKARAYREKVESASEFRLAAWPEDVVHTFKDFTVRVPEGWGQQRRDAAIALLAERGVETRAYFFPPVHEQEFFRGFADRPLPRTEALSRQVITLPFFTSITAEQMDYVADQLHRAEKEIA